MWRLLLTLVLIAGSLQWHWRIHQQPQPVQEGLPAPLFPRSVLFEPNERMYQAWLAEAHECSGLPIETWRPARFYMVPDSSLYRVNDSTIARAVFHVARDGTPEFYFTPLTMLRKQTVMHEMLHALGMDMHPYDIMVEKCHLMDARVWKWQQGNQ